MNDFTHDLRDDRSRLARDVHVLIDDAQELLRHAASDAGSELTQARSRLEASVAAARGRLAAMQADLRRGVGDATHAGADYVRRHPWQAAGITAAVGIALALLLRQRQD